MLAKELARQLRQSGLLWNFADGPVLRFRVQQLESGVRPMMETDKSKASDEYLIKAAATCDTCGMSASNSEIIQAIKAADDVESFSEIIRPLIEHRTDCLTFLEMEGDYFEPPRKVRNAKKKRSTKTSVKHKSAKTVKKAAGKKSAKKKVAKKPKAAKTKPKRGRRK